MTTGTPDSHRAIDIDLTVNAMLHLWLKAVTPNEPGSVSFYSVNGKSGEVQAANAEENLFRICQVFGGGTVALAYDMARTPLSVAYWFTPSDVLETVITVIHTNPANGPSDFPGAIVSARPSAG